MLKRPAILFLSIILFSAASSHADWRDISVTRFKLAPPPTEGNDEDRNDLETVRKYERTRSREECAQGRKQQFPNPPALFEGETKAMHAFLKDVFQLVTDAAGQFKHGYGRARPYMRDTSIKPCVKPPGTAKTSYPSSHAAMGVVGACTLAKLYPERARELEDHGERVGELRVIVGVHHPSDVKAGQELGHQICKVLLGDRSFVSELSLLRR